MVLLDVGGKAVRNFRVKNSMAEVTPDHLQINFAADEQFRTERITTGMPSSLTLHLCWITAMYYTRWEVKSTDCAASVYSRYTVDSSMGAMRF